MSSQITFNLLQGSVRCSFSPQAASELKAALEKLVADLKALTVAKQGGAKATAVASMEHQYIGEVFLEVFCNPNIWPTPFAAKLLITLRDERIRLTTEAELTQVIEDVNLYLEQAS
jgi:hypothetical protein